MAPNNLNRMTSTPLEFARSQRLVGKRVLTSLPAGKIVPLAAVPLFREDELMRGQCRISFEMLETAELLMNAVYVNVKAYLVPWLAFDRFENSMEQLNRSYAGQPKIAGGATVPFFEKVAMGAHGSKALYKYLGLHAKSATEVNTMYAEAYNQIVNLRLKNRSPELPLRNRLDYTLAPAFWRHENFAHIVPDFDQAVIDGEVALNYVGGGVDSAPVMGLGFQASSIPALTSSASTRNLSDGSTVVSATSGTTNRWTTADATNVNMSYKVQDGNNNFPDIRADLSAFLEDLSVEGFTISLSNIEMARKTQAFARLREQYTEHEEDWLIDMLMSGMYVPDQQLKQPMLIADQTTIFGQSKRYATDSGALDESAVNGATSLQLNMRVPRLSTGGIIMVTAEITPEQMFERKKDYFFHLSTVDALPEALRDTLDPEKVEIVTNDYVDVQHGTPAGVFGYAPMNHWANGIDYNIGGKFLRPETNTTTDEVRQRLWSCEAINPVLGPDFYLATTVHQKPFLDTLADPFEAVMIADFQIAGNTQFGGMLVEANNNYDEVMEKAPTERIDKGD